MKQLLISDASHEAIAVEKARGGGTLADALDRIVKRSAELELLEAESLVNEQACIVPPGILNTTRRLAAMVEELKTQNAQLAEANRG